MVLIRRIQREGKFAADTVKFADGQDDVAREFIAQLAERIRVLAEAPEVPLKDPV